MQINTRNAIAMLSLAIAFAIPAGLSAQSEEVKSNRVETRITVRVENGNWLDMRIYAVRQGGMYDRIGTVRSFTSREFKLPSWITASNAHIQLVAVPIGATQRYAAPPVMVSQGDVIEWKLANNLSLSNIFVRAG